MPLHPEEQTDPLPVFWPESWPHPDRLRERLPYWMDTDGILAAGEILGAAGQDCDPIGFAQMATLSWHLTPPQVAEVVVALCGLQSSS